MKKALFSMMMAVIMMTASGSLWAYGTAADSLVTNANTVGQSPDLRIATNAGQLSANFENVSGVTNFASVQGAAAVTKVTNGYDLSRILMTTASNQTGSAGSSVIFTVYVTNWGNCVSPIGMMATNLMSSGSWPTNTYVVLINDVMKKSNVKTPRGDTNDIASGNFVKLQLRVDIPISMVDGSSNVFKFMVGNYLTMNGLGGDNWPGPFAIAPATTDTNAWGGSRDGQEIRCVVHVSGPVLRISKTVDKLVIKPFEVLTYTISYTNAGTANALNVTVQDMIPSYTTNIQNPEIELNGGGFVAAGVDAVITPKSIRFTPNGGGVASGEFGRLRFTVIVK